MEPPDEPRATLPSAFGIPAPCERELYRQTVNAEAALLKGPPEAFI